MIALALLCLLLAAAAVVFMLTAASLELVSFSFFAGDFVTRPIWIFVAGAATMLLTLAGLSFFRRGTSRKVAQRREIKRLRKVEETATPPAAAESRNDPAPHDPAPHDPARNDPAPHDPAHGHPHDDAEETLVREPRPASDEGRRRS